MGPSSSARCPCLLLRLLPAVSAHAATTINVSSTVTVPQVKRFGISGISHYYYDRLLLKNPSHSARIVLRAHETSGAIGATEPLAAKGMQLPSGVTPMSGGGPSHGPSTRTKWPWARSERANPSTCPWTPPGRVRL